MDKKRVLIVDDEKDLCRILKLNLEDTDKYEVLTLSTPRDILSHVQSFKPDVILLDLLMPELNGIEACEMLNKSPVDGKKIPIIIISALDKDEDKIRAYKKGASDYLVKPVERDELIAKIENILQRGKG
ncbi:MAG: response regulator transcription factor [Candidatus Omnitrophica bacterium]|nr:response regulator transcription factor [Candidatus Omnitrophota bacterium]MBU1852736.1 response regulator transcription factor [Candidatus Omnitrophota bacterium]